MDHAALIERLEKATRMDRDLDIAIARACPRKGWRVERDGTVSAFDGEGWYSMPTEVPTYTHSIDAALTLVPENREWEIGSAFLAGMYWAAIVGLDRNDQGRGSTAAIALCIAALKARVMHTAVASAGGTASDDPTSGQRGAT